MAENLQPFKSLQQELTLEGGCPLWEIRVIFPTKLQPQNLQKLHSGHLGMSRMKSLTQGYMWQPGLDQATEDVAKSCQQCQACKSAPAAAPLHPWVWASRPWQCIHVDFARPFTGKMFLIAVDAHSKWLEVVEMINVSTSKTIAALQQTFTAYAFQSKWCPTTDLISLQLILLISCTTVGSNTFCVPRNIPPPMEQQNDSSRPSKNAMKAGKNADRSLQQCLDNFLLTNQTTPHTTTSQAPYYSYNATYVTC